MSKRETLVARRYLVSGRVQGVGYRYFAERAANGLGIRGYVRNLPDGRVEAYAIGSPGALDGFDRRLRDGPPAALVAGVEITEEAVNAACKRFEIQAW
ncbi:MAG: acylphosphatase [Terriglobia bacterium]